MSGIGNQMTDVALIFQVYALTRSSIVVGAIGLFTAVPAIAVALAGGTITDAVDRRKLVLVCGCQAGVFCRPCAAGLAPSAH